MAVGSFLIHPSHLNSSSTTAANISVGDSIKSATPSTTHSYGPDDIPRYSLKMPVGAETEFALRGEECIARLGRLKNQEITLIPSPKALEKSSLPFPLLNVNLADLSNYLGRALQNIFWPVPTYHLSDRPGMRPSVPVWLVGGAARDVIAKGNFNDFDLCVYCENLDINASCLAFKKESPLFIYIERAILAFVIQELSKTPGYDTFKDHPSLNYFVRLAYLTNRKIFDDGSGCLYSLGGKIDIKIVFALDKPKSVADADGIHIRLNSEIPILQCANGKYWCANESARALALYNARCRYFIVQDSSSIRDLIFRLILESRHGFQINLDDIETGFKQMILDYPTQKLFTDSFCRHQINHCKDQMSRIIDFLTWITYAKHQPNQVRMIACAWLEGTKKIGLSEDVEIPLAIFFHQYPEKASEFLAFLRGHLLLLFAESKETSLEAYAFPFMESPTKPKEQFCFSSSNNEYYLFTGQSPLKIANEFLTYNQSFIKFLQDKRIDVRKLGGLFNYLKIDPSVLTKKEILTNTARKFFTAFVNKKLAAILKAHYPDSFSLKSWFEWFSSQRDIEGLQLVAATKARDNLNKRRVDNLSNNRELNELIGVILGEATHSLEWMAAPMLLHNFFNIPPSREDEAEYLSIKDDIVRLFPDLVKMCKKDTSSDHTKMAKLHSLFSMYEILYSKNLLSYEIQSELLMIMLTLCSKIVVPVTQEIGWIDSLCNYALLYTFSNPTVVVLDKIEIYLFALERLAKSRHEHFLVSTFHHLESALNCKGSERDHLIIQGRLGTIVDQLIRNSRRKPSFQLSRQICIVFDHMNRNHKSFLMSLRDRSSLLEHVIDAAQDMGPYFSQDAMYETTVYRVLQALEELSDFVNPSLLRLFNSCLSHPNQSSELIRILSEVAIKLLNRKCGLDKSHQERLFAIAFKLLGIVKKDKSSSINFQQLGLGLIEGISKQWSKRDEEFDIIRQQFLERIAHCLLKKEKYIEKTKQRLPLYIQAYTILSLSERKSLELLNSIQLMDLHAFKTKARATFIEFLKTEAPDLLEIEVFVKLQSSFKVIKEDSKRTSVRLPTAAAAPPITTKPKGEKESFDQLLIRNTDRIISSNAKSFHADLQRNFKILLAHLKEVDESVFAALDRARKKEVIFRLKEIFKLFLNSPHLSFVVNAYTLFYRMKSYNFLGKDEIEELCLSLINKFTAISVTAQFNYLEILLSQFFEINASKALKLSVCYGLLNAYEVILKHGDNPDLEKVHMGLTILFQEPSIINDKGSSTKLGILSYKLIRYCLGKKSENHYAIAVSTLNQLICTPHLDHVHLHAEFELLSFLLVTRLPQSWKNEPNSLKLKSLLEAIEEKNMLLHLSHSVRFHLFQLMKQSDHSLLVDFATKWNKIYLGELSKGAYNRDFDSCMKILKRGIVACDKENNVVVQECAEWIRNNLDFFKSVVSESELHESLIKIFAHTEVLSYQVQACEIFMTQPPSSDAFSQLLEGFNKIPLNNPKDTSVLKRYFIDVVAHYGKILLPNAKGLIQLKPKYKSDLLKFLKRFSAVSGRASESIEMLSLFFIHFSFLKDPVSLLSINTILNHLKKELMQCHKIQELARLCFLVITYLDADSKKSFLEPLNPYLIDSVNRKKGLGKVLTARAKRSSDKSRELKGIVSGVAEMDSKRSKDKRRSAMDEFRPVSPEELIKFLPIYYHFDPMMMQGLILSYANEALQQRSDFSSVLKLMMEGYNQGIFRKYSIESWLTGDITKDTTGAPLEIQMNLDSMNEHIIEFLSLNKIPGSLNMLAEYFKFLLEHSLETPERITWLLKHYGYVTQILTISFLNTGESASFINHMKELSKVMRRKRWDELPIENYLATLGETIQITLLYPTILRKLKGVAFMVQKGLGKKTFSYSKMLEMFRTEGVLDDWVATIHRGLANKISCDIDYITFCVCNYIRFGADNEKFEYAIREELMLDRIKVCLDLIEVYMKESIEIERRQGKIPNHRSTSYIAIKIYFEMIIKALNQLPETPNKEECMIRVEGVIHSINTQYPKLTM